MRCVNCKHYEAYHKDPNPNSTTRHYCLKCDAVIYATQNIDGSFKNVIIPKKCYFNNYFDFIKSIAAAVCDISEAMVIGPTPPGTGV